MTDEGRPPCLSAKGFRAVSGSEDPDREAEAEREEKRHSQPPTDEIIHAL